MEKTLPIILRWDESFDIGSDTLTGVNDADYQPPLAFTGTLSKLTLKVDRPKLSPEDIRHSRMRKLKRSTASRCITCRAGLNSPLSYELT